MRRLGDFILAGHPLRAIRQIVSAALVQMGALFCGVCEADIKGSRPSTAFEKLMRAMLLQEFIGACFEMRVVPHVAQNTFRRRPAVPE